MLFYLGTHRPDWLGKTEVPLFVSRRRLTDRKTFPVARGRWCLDSGGFTELNLYHYWTTPVDEFVADVRRFDDEIGGMDWAAPMDWMCEPFMVEKTGLTVMEHQFMTVRNFIHLREELGMKVIPVLQGWEPDEYLRCWHYYDQLGVDLESEPVVGLGSVCRRQNTNVAGQIVRLLQPLRLHGFGVKLTGLANFGDLLVSSDSMSWSYQARMGDPLPGHTHKSCANCLEYALRWREKVVSRGTQMEMVA